MEGVHNSLYIKDHQEVLWQTKNKVMSGNFNNSFAIIKTMKATDNYEQSELVASHIQAISPNKKK